MSSLTELMNDPELLKESVKRVVNGKSSKIVDTWSAKGPIMKGLADRVKNQGLLSDEEVDALISDLITVFQYLK